jgi:Transcriptional regulator, AbiEi antitoxin
MDPRLRSVAECRGGVLTTAQAATLDVDEHGLVRLCRAGELVRVRRGAYVLGEAWRDGDAGTRAALRTRAVLASRSPSSVASHEAALALHRLPVDGRWPAVIDLRADVSRVRLVGGVRLHPRGGVRSVVVDGFRAVPIDVAIAQVTLRSGLLAGLVPLDRALHERRVTREEVALALAACAVTPAARHRADELVARGDPACESVGETRTRLLLTDLGFAPRSQVEVRDGKGAVVARVDFLVGDHVVVEFDGAVKYEGVEGRAALVAEKRREDRLRALGYAVVRVTWADLEHPGRVSALVRRALAQNLHSPAGAPAS